MNYKDEIMSFVAKNPGATSYRIWNHLDTVKATAWTNIGGIRGWLAKHNSTFARANLGKIHITLDDLIEEGKIENRSKSGKRNSYYIIGDKL